VENLVTTVEPFRGARVLVTGHTGIKGAWLAEWLLQKGARVSGIALPPEANSLFGALRLADRLSHAEVDIRDAQALAAAVTRADPEFIFHLAAQALVRRSYREPLYTWQTNVDGTLNVLEAAKALGRRVVVVVVTTDKVYRNREWEFSYREEDELGGHDPYSASKAACEIAVASWRASFAPSCEVKVATARAGNVLGAGDTSEDRIVPDCFRAWSRGSEVLVRNPLSTRPWQHVLEPLSGYLALSAHMSEGTGATIDACNFGPGPGGDRTVRDLVDAFVELDPRRRWTTGDASQHHEARSLSLAIDRARHVLGWTPRLSFDETVEWTNAGYVASPVQLPALIDRHIADYESRLSGSRSQRPEVAGHV
jgi:CDP-glucose 4,6-dehydratase